MIENFNSEDCTNYFDFIKIDTTKNAAESGTQTYSLKSRAGKNSPKVEYDESGEVEFIDATSETYITIWEPEEAIKWGKDSNEFQSFFNSQKPINGTEATTFEYESVSNSSGITIDPSVKAYFKVFWNVNWGENNFTVELGIKANGTITIELTYKEDHTITDDSTFGNLSAGEWKLPLTPAIQLPTGIPGIQWYFAFSIPIEWSIKGRLAFSVDFSFEACQKFVNGKKQNPISLEPKLTPNIEATVTGEFFAGISAEVGASLGTVGKPIFKISAEFTAGGKVEATMGLKTSLPPAESIHKCALCLEATLKPKITLTIKGEINAAKKITLPQTVIDLEIPRIKGEFYVSFINAESSVHKGKVKFGFGECPNVTHRSAIAAYDYYGNEYPFKLTGYMMCSDGSVKEIPDTLNAEEGYYYLYNGNYRVTSTIDGKNYTRTFDVSNSTNSINILEYTVKGNIKRDETNAGVSNATVTVYLRDGTVIDTYKTGTSTSSGMLDTTKTKFNLPVGYSKIYVKVEYKGCLPYYTAFSVPNTTGILDLSTIDLQERSQNQSSISGIIVDTHDKALSEVIVELYDSEGKLVYNTVADKNGVYNFAVELSNGQYSLNFVKSGYAYNKILPKIIISDAPQTSYSVVILDESGYIVTGFIHDTDNKPISGVRVEISNAAGEIIAPAYTDINGKFILYQSLPYAYTLRFIKDGYQSSTMTQPANTADIGIHKLASCYTIKGVVVNEKDIGLENAVVQVLNADGSLNTWEFSSSDGSFVIDLVDTGSYSLYITMDNYEEIVKGFTVNERVTDVGWIPMKAATTFSVTHTANNVTTDILAASPIEMYNGIAPMTWTINSSEPWKIVTNRGDWFSLSVDGESVGLNSTFDAGETELKLNISKYTDSRNDGTIAFAVGDETHTVEIFQKAYCITGTIIAGDTPVSGAKVFVSNEYYTSGEITTGDDGKFSIPVPNAWYDITINTDVYGEVVIPSAEAVDGKDYDVGVIDLAPIAVSGTITIDGKPVSGAEVTITNGTITIILYTDENGNYYTNLPEGWYTVSVAVVGYAKYETTVHVTGSSDSTCTIDTIVPEIRELLTSATGTIVDSETGDPLEDVDVNLVFTAADDDEITNAYSTSMADGTYRFDFFEEGTCSITYSHPEYNTVTVEDIVITADSTTFDEVKMTAKSIIGNGECGDNLEWLLYDDYTLVIKGTGEMWDYAYESANHSTAPWSEYGELIKKAVCAGRITSIGKYAFCNCIAMEEIDLPNTIESIGDWAFSECKNLAGFDFPEQLEYLGECVFSNSEILNRTIYLPAKLNYIGSGTFAFTGVENIYVDDQNTMYSDIDGVLFNKDKTILIRYPMERWETSYTVPQGVVKIDSWGFAQTRLTEIILPSTLKIIEYAGIWNNSLNSLIIPESVTEIHDIAFEYSYSLKNIYFMGNSPTVWGRTVISKDFPTTIRYISGKSGWTSPTWTAPDGTVYQTATWDPENTN